jgi:hypothetical protein
MIAPDHPVLANLVDEKAAAFPRKSLCEMLASGLTHLGWDLA